MKPPEPGEDCELCGHRRAKSGAMYSAEWRAKRNGQGDAEAEVVNAEVGGEESAGAIPIDACAHSWGASVFVKAMGRMKRACTTCGETELV